MTVAPLSSWASPELSRTWVYKTCPTKWSCSTTCGSLPSSRPASPTIKSIRTRFANTGASTGLLLMRTRSPDWRSVWSISSCAAAFSPGRRSSRAFFGCERQLWRGGLERARPRWVGRAQAPRASARRVRPRLPARQPPRLGVTTFVGVRPRYAATRCDNFRWGQTPLRGVTTFVGVRPRVVAGRLRHRAEGARLGSLRCLAKCRRATARR